MPEPYRGVKFEAEKVGSFTPTAPERKNIEKLVSLKETYVKYGFLDRNGGNFSFRADQGFIIKRTGVWIDKITGQDFVRVTDVRDGRVFYEGDNLPSSECRTHFYIYQNVPTVNFVFHAHALEIAEKVGIEADPCCIPVLSYGTMELAEIVSQKAKTMPFVIAKNHGVFAFGATFEETKRVLIDSYEQYRKFEAKTAQDN